QACFRLCCCGVRVFLEESPDGLGQFGSALLSPLRDEICMPTVGKIRRKEWTALQNALSLLPGKPSQEMPKQRGVQMTTGDNPISNRELRDGDFPSYDSSRVGEIDPVMWALRGVGQNERRAARAASGAASALAVIGDAWRDIIQHDRLQVTNVNAHLESRGAT